MPAIRPPPPTRDEKRRDVAGLFLELKGNGTLAQQRSSWSKA